MLRKAATASSPVVEISGSFDGVWSITTSTILRTHTVTFKVRKKRPTGHFRINLFLRSLGKSLKIRQWMAEL